MPSDSAASNRGLMEEMKGESRGCYRCGRWPVKFGGVVRPAIILLDILVPRRAQWWTDCPDCGYVEVVE